MAKFYFNASNTPLARPPSRPLFHNPTARNQQQIALPLPATGDPRSGNAGLGNAGRTCGGRGPDRTERMTRKAMRPATPAVMGRNLAVPCGNRRRSQGSDSNEHHPRVVEAQQANAGETAISQMPFARGASRKSTNKPRKPWRHNGTSQSATQGFAPVRLGLSGPALWVPQVGISLCRTTRKARDLTDLPP